MQPKNGTSLAYQRLDTNSSLSSCGTKQSSSSEPADGTVYITIDAPTCPDMMKRQQPSTEATTDNTAVTSRDLSSLSRQQLLQYIAQLHDNDCTKDATIDSQADTIGSLTWKVDTLQELLGISISSAGRVKMVSAQLDARRQQAGPAHAFEAVREQQQQRQQAERQDVISKSGKLLLEYGSLCGRLHSRDRESSSKRAELQQQATQLLARMHCSGAAVTAQYYFMLTETGNKNPPARMNTPKSRLSA